MKTPKYFPAFCLLSSYLFGCNLVLDLPPVFTENGGNAGNAGESSGGKSSTGGTKAKGGTTSKGGSKATGGKPSTGGTTNTGTTTENGGTSNPGGTTAVGGTSSTGGVTSTTVAAPVITSFTVDYNKVCSGNTATLRAVYSNGTGTVSGGVGTIISGVATTTRAVVADASYTLTVTNSKGEKADATVNVTVLPSGKFTRTGNMNVARYFHTSTLLQDGRVLIAGGVGAYQDAELYDLNTGAFTIAGKMAKGRESHTATMLPNGKVVIIGYAGAEVYDPTTGVFTESGALKEMRYSHSAAYVESSKRVIVIGGWWGGETVMRDTAELFDPTAGVNGEFVVSMKLPRDLTDHASAMLDGGYVLSVGYARNNMLYEPNIGPNGTFTTNELIDGPGCNTREAVIALSDGTALVSTSPLQIVTRNFATVSFTQTFSPARNCPTMTLLQNGNVLVIGGADDPSAVVVDPFLRTVAATGSMTTIRKDPSTTLLGNGAVLVTGGSIPPSTDSPIATAELYCP